MGMGTAAMATSLDGFHATATAQRADELARTLFDALNIAREESRAVVGRLYDGVISTGRPDDADMVTEGYIQNSGWTPDGRAAFASAIAISRGAMPDGRALQTHIVAENNRLASRSVWDVTINASGRPADFTTLDFFRIEDGLIAEHWESVDWVRVYQSFGLLPDDITNA
jgi:predicted SnoaL-like aldol condensation-catalyzing enzyme